MVLSLMAKILTDLNEYRDRPEIKGVLFALNSPAGSCGPSQEIYAELKRVREELKKPEVVSCNGVLPVRLYAAVSADKNCSKPGHIDGFHRLIMEFINLEGVYNWRKSIVTFLKTGKYKDTGADYRAMTEDERKLMQTTLDDVGGSLKHAVAEGRNLSPQFVEQYADGRIFTGEAAVSWICGSSGNSEDAEKAIGRLTGLGDSPEIFEIPKKHNNVLELLMDDGLSDSCSI